MATNEDEPHPPSGGAALAAAGEAAAFIAGAPIAGVAESAVGLGDVVAEQEARLEEALMGGSTKPASRRWLRLAIAVVVMAIGLLLLLR